MSNLFFALCFAFVAQAEKTSTDTETSTWKKVDKSLNDGVKTFKKKFMDAEEKPAAPKKPENSGNGKELEKLTDSVNEVWDNSLKGVGKVLKTQEVKTSTSTDTSTATPSH